MTNVLCIGAGHEQIPSILEAQKMQLFVTAIDGNPAAEGLSIADKKMVIDIAKVETVLDALRELDFSLILPTPIGRMLSIIGTVNETFGLRGITKQAAINCTDKLLFHQLLCKNGLKRPKQAVAVGKESLLKTIKSIKAPCIMKPRFGSGSNGVVVIQNDSEIEKAVDEHLKSSTEEFDSLVEELVNGDEFGVDGAVVNGEFVLTLVRKKILTPLPYRQEIGYIAPASLENAVYKRIISEINQCAKVLGLNNCLINADVMITDKQEPVIIEIAGRPGGLLISNKIIPSATGLNFLASGIKMLLGETTDFQPKSIRPTVLYFLPFSEGVIRLAYDPQKIQVMEGVLEFNCMVKSNEMLNKIKCGRDVYQRGYVMTTGGTIEEAVNNANDVINELKYTVEER